MASRIEQEVLIRFKSDTKGLEKGSKKAQKALGDTAKSTKAATQQMGEASQGIETFGRLGGALPGKLGPIAGSVGALAAAFKGAKQSSLAFGLAMAGIIGVLIRYADELAEVIMSLDKLAKSSQATAEETYKNELATEGMLGATKGLKAALDELFPEKARASKYEEQLKLLQMAWVSGRLKTDEYTEAIHRLNKALAETRPSREIVLAMAAFAAGGPQAGALIMAALAGSYKKPARRGKKGAGKGDKPEFADEAGPFGFTPGDPSSFQGPGSSIGKDRAASQAGAIGGPGRYEQIFSEQAALRESVKESEIVISSFGLALLSTSNSVIGAFELWGAGAISLGDALKSALGNAIGDILMGEAKKHGALAAADFFTGNPVGGAGHLAAAAGLAATSGAVRNFLGADSGAGGGSGGGRGGGLPGAAAGSFGGGGGGTNSQEIYIVEVPFGDSPRKRRKEIYESLTRTRKEHGGGSTVTRQ